MKSKNYFITAKKEESQMPSSVYPNGFHVETIPSFSTASVIDPSVHSPDDADDNETEDNFNSDESADLETGMQNC
eukprot:13260859-Ditylum_brightwellii.AAC.1